MSSPPNCWSVVVCRDSCEKIGDIMKQNAPFLKVGSVS